MRPAATKAAMLLLLSALAQAHPPLDVSNFQNAFACDPARSLIVRPRTADDVIEAVKAHAHVISTGEGHSWNQPFFCVAPAANASSSANIVLTTIRLLAIAVNESDASVWVDAGVKTTDLLAVLSNAVTPRAPAGWTLGAFPWFVYQSAGGAVATGTHGSSLEHNSISHQVLALDVVLANGTRRTFSPETDPFLFKALLVSVGKLGVLLRVKLRIVKEVPVRRTLKALRVPEFLTLVESAQEAWTTTGSPPAWMNEAQIFWLPQQHQFMLVGFTRADADNATDAAQALSGTPFLPDSTTVFTRKGDAIALGELVLPADAAVRVNASQVLVAAPNNATQASHNAELYQAAQRWVDGYLDAVINRPLTANDTGAASEAERTLGVAWQLPIVKTPSAFYGAESNAETLLNVSRLGITTVAGNLTAEASSIYIKQPAVSLPNLQNTPYDQYEVSIPLAAMGTCWRKLLDAVYAGDLGGTNATQRARDKGFRTAPLIRFVGREDGLLSHTHDGPRMYVNIEDYKFYNTLNKVNTPFKAVMAVLRGDPACTSKGPPRLHWGKAGWPDAGCWHGDAEFGGSWCDFGCAVRALDPQRKFSDSAPDRWTWAGVDLGKCCGADGFQAGRPGCECKVQHARAMADCPPAPFYTSR